jgi:hypothetical protein
MSYPFQRGFAATSSGEKTSDVAIDTGSGYLCGIIVRTDGSNVATAILYDSLGASGTKLYEGGSLGNLQSKEPLFTIPIEYNTGLYLDITGTGASAIVYYRSR